MVKKTFFSTKKKRIEQIYTMVIQWFLQVYFYIENEHQELIPFCRSSVMSFILIKKIVNLAQFKFLSISFH